MNWSSPSKTPHSEPLEGHRPFSSLTKRTLLFDSLLSSSYLTRSLNRDHQIPHSAPHRHRGPTSPFAFSQPLHPHSSQSDS